MKKQSTACEHCIDCFFLDRELPEDGGRELCILGPAHPVEVNYSNKVCSYFELSDTVAEERRKAPGEL